MEERQTVIMVSLAVVGGLVTLGLIAVFHFVTNFLPRTTPNTQPIAPVPSLSVVIQSPSPSQQPSRLGMLNQIFGQDRSSVDKKVDEPTPTPMVELEPIPRAKTLVGSNHYFQTFNNCGPASLSMTLSYFEIDVSQSVLGNQLRPYQNQIGNNDDKSVTLAELAAKATDYDLLTYHRPAGNMEMVEQFIAHDIPVIARTWLEPNEDIGHYRVILGYDQDTRTLIQDDSLQGQGLVYSYQEFNQLWKAFNYEFLVVVPEDQRLVAEQILGTSLDEGTAWLQAKQQAQKAVSENPDDTYARFNLLVAHVNLGEYQAAVDIYQQIESALPSRMLWYQIEPILAYYHLGEYDQVIALSEEIFQSENRAFSELHYLRGLIFEQQNQTQAAEQAFALAERYNPSSYWKQNLSGIPVE